MALLSPTIPLTGHVEFDSLIESMAISGDDIESEKIRSEIWSRFGTEGAVFISDMASFSSTSRKIGVCHFLKLIYRARQLISPIIAANHGVMLKCDADNCYAWFQNTDDAIRASIEINIALLEANSATGMAEQIHLSVGIDHGKVLLVADRDFFGDPVNTASKLGEDLAGRAEVLVTDRALATSTYALPEFAERMVARISGIEIEYVRLPMTSVSTAS